MQKVLLVLLCNICWMLPLRSQSLHSPDERDGYIIQLKEDAPLAYWMNRVNFRSSFPFTVQEVLSTGMKILWLQDHKKDNNDQLLAQLREHPQVKNAQFNVLLQDRSIPDDPFWDAQDNLRKMGVLNMWANTFQGQTQNGIPIVLGILEPAGFDTEHEDLKANIWTNSAETPYDSIDNDENGFIDDFWGWNALSDNDDHFTTVPHGTKVAGVMSAVTNNDKGVAGIAWNSKMLLLSGNRWASHVVENYDYALQLRRQFNETNGEKGAFIVATNASLGIPGDPADFPVWCEVYDALGKAGILNVSAAANQPLNIDLRSDMPTSCSSEFLITVTSVDEFDRFVTSRAYGPETVDIAAPGKGMITTAPLDQYQEITEAANSYAAPQVTGAIGLMYSLPYPDIQEQAIQQPSETAMLMKSFLMNGVQKLSTLKAKIKSEGRLDLYRTQVLMHEHFQQFERKLTIDNIFPNPFYDEVGIDIAFPEAGSFAIRIFDYQGRLVYQNSYQNRMRGNQLLRLPLDHLLAGIYSVQVTGAGEVATKKLVKGL